MSGASSVATPRVLYVRDPNVALPGQHDPVAHWLELARYAVTTATVATCAAQLAESTPALIVTDSTELCTQLKAHHATSAIPVLQLLAADSPDLTLGVEADACLPRPVQHSALLSTVRLLLKLQREGVDSAQRVELERRDEFLAMLAHELRNPLNAIVAANELQSRPLAEPREAARLHSVVARQSTHLSHLIDDLLEASRVTRGEIVLRLAPIDLRAVVASAVESQRVILERQDRRIQVELPQQALMVDGDAVRIEQALCNLLANAAKYSNRGSSITLDARIHEDGQSAVLTLRDHGIGIPPDMLEAVFDMFVQADRSLDRSRGGLGLGLTVAKQLIEKHGGQLEAHSEGIGCGASFTVTLPLLPSPTPRKLPDASEHGAQTAPLDVLVIEDNDDTRELMCALLENHGYRVSSAADGCEGLEIATHHVPEVALIDIGLPGMNGYAVARNIRERQPGSSVVLVALTGYGSPADRARASAAGFDMHFVKPLDPARLFALLERVADDRARAHMLPAHASIEPRAHDARTPQ